MKSVLISIQPKWCELIASGKKTVEVRKTKPKLETPFKCYIYCTMPKNNHDNLVLTPFGYDVGSESSYCNYVGNSNGKVIGEFVCDRIYNIKLEYDFQTGSVSWECGYYAEEDCLSMEEFEAYLTKGYGYGWHISDLKLYDKPRELSEFSTPCKMKELLCGICDYAVHGMDGDLIGCNTSLKRPFQSWGYVNEIDT